MMSEFPLISVSGTPSQRGQSYGTQARGRINRGVKLYSQRLGELGITTDDLNDLVSRYLPLIKAFDPNFVLEMEAIATGAEVNFSEIMLINARTEILALVDRKTAVEEHSKDGCSCAAVLPDRCADHRLLHGQNWDWTPECADTAVILRVQPDKGPSFLTFTEAGSLARNGLNDAGISLTANYLECDRDFKSIGVPLALIRRKVLEQQHYAHALQIVSTTKKTTSNNMMIAHKDGFAISFECAPDEAFNIYPYNDLLVHTNHWLSPIALNKLKTQSAKNWADSFYRDWRLRKCLQDAGQVTFEAFKTAFMDRFGSPFSVCRPPSALSEGNTMTTVATIAMDPASGSMDVARLPSEGGPFIRYSLTEPRPHKTN